VAVSVTVTSVLFHPAAFAAGTDVATVAGGVVSGCRPARGPAGAVAPSSKAPASQFAPKGRGAPRWSTVASQGPMSTAGVPGMSAIVSVGPPLSTGSPTTSG